MADNLIMRFISGITSSSYLSTDQTINRISVDYIAARVVPNFPMANSISFAPPIVSRYNISLDSHLY